MTGDQIAVQRVIGANIMATQILEALQRHDAERGRHETKTARQIAMKAVRRFQLEAEQVGFPAPQDAKWMAPAIALAMVIGIVIGAMVAS